MFFVLMLVAVFLGFLSGFLLEDINTLYDSVRPHPPILSLLACPPAYTQPACLPALPAPSALPRCRAAVVPHCPASSGTPVAAACHAGSEVK